MKEENRNPRARAVQILTRVLAKNQLLEDALPANLHGLSDLDRSLARAIASTTLRHLGIIDALIDKMMDRPLPQAAANIRNVIRIGIAQVLFMNVASHAAVHDTVELIPSKSKFKGLVNALLRRTGRQGQKLLSRMDLPRTNTPAWLWESWIAFYGEEAARRIAEAHRHEAPLDITVKSDAEGWAEKLDAICLPTGSVRRTAGGAVSALPGFDDGQWWVQDTSASLPARLFGDVQGKHIVDLCAAPGGKAAQLAFAGARVTAVDKSSARLKRLDENMTRLALEVETAVSDAVNFVPETPADGILLDAPCSSTGTLRRHPDVAWLKTPDDIEKLAKLQERLLDAAVGSLKKDGILVYSTCSLQPEEGEHQIRRLLERHGDLKRLPVTPDEVGGLSEIVTKDGDIRCLPYHLANQENESLGGMDGFYACRLVKSPG
ncbi:16S rRNA (cytosine(967)-C(5))-methyltransferase RsmB [Sneathiella chinensis]|uniref:16S rRNA (cytosine(967)-C(5))-methyltransferase n=1 Tax=Sneathiella chinensis TaxID=349750 RepID=A0ABQ5U158_9PROT|nr:16S rRNA (cytosine(967)-C(5))-methyltransferase RsmB [Sneathiella chinensis]GLQ05034.1 MFS transporter [Sneathiella chinensis]